MVVAQNINVRSLILESDPSHFNLFSYSIIGPFLYCVSHRRAVWSSETHPSVTMYLDFYCRLYILLRN